VKLFSQSQTVSLNYSNSSWRLIRYGLGSITLNNAESIRLFTGGEQQEGSEAGRPAQLGRSFNYDRPDQSREAMIQVASSGFLPTTSRAFCMAG